MTVKSDLTSTSSGQKLWHQERSIFETTNMLCELMDKDDVSRTELAKRLGATKGYVSQLLDGSTNMTLRTISDAFLALGYQFHPTCSPLNDESSPSMVVESEVQADGYAKESVVAASTAFREIRLAIGVRSSQQPTLALIS